MNPHDHPPATAGGPDAERDLPSPAALAHLREALRCLHLPGGSTADAGAAQEETADPEPAPASALREDRDPLPEFLAYPDTGCEVAPSCLHCPLPVCVLDRFPQPRRHARQLRDRRLRGLAAHGWSTARLARRFGLSGSQVRRIRARKH
jgi:hypothetical protein